jgi:hypothetical protein
MPCKWQPTQILRYVKTVPTSTNVAIVDTDVGKGYLKAIGNPEGEHALACEWVGTQLADWFGLRTFDYALIELDAEVNEIPFTDRSLAKSGHGFITRGEDGDKWSGTDRELKRLANPDDITRLVVFDTWVQNRDRHREGLNKPDNVFISTEGPPGKLVLVVSDHTHCFARLNQFSRELADSFISSIPDEWQVPRDARNALAELVVARANYVAENIVSKLWKQKELDFMDASETES